MKIILLSIIISLILGLSEASHAQFIGLKGGLNYSSFKGEDIPGALTPRLGVNAGIFTDFKLNNIYSIQVEALYSQQGAKFRGEIPGFNDTLAYYEITENCNYISFPILLNIGTSSKYSKLFLSLGIMPQIMLENDHKQIARVGGFPISATQYFTEKVQFFDMPLVAGIGTVFRGWYFDIRAHLSPFLLYKGDAPLEIRNTHISISIGYAYFSPLPKNRKPKKILQ